MLSYQHGFHAGNRADILKHAVLHAILSGLKKSGQKILYVETHAGRGLYDLTGKQAKKTGEAEQGVLSMLGGTYPKPLKPWMETVAKAGPKAYPGSPVLAAKCLDERDRLVLFEKHPQEYDALHNVLKHDDRVQVKRADGYGGALKLAPRSGEQMVVLVDPSYETMRDMDALAEWAPRALRRWPKAVLIIWLPLFRDERELDFGAYLSELTEGAIAGARWPIDPMEETALEGTAMVAYRTSEATGEKMASIASSLQSFWATQNK